MAASAGTEVERVEVRAGASSLPESTSAYTCVRTTLVLVGLIAMGIIYVVRLIQGIDKLSEEIIFVLLISVLALVSLIRALRAWNQTPG